MIELYWIVDGKEEKELQNRDAYYALNTILERNNLISSPKPHWKINLYQGKIDQKSSRVQNELRNMYYEENKSEDNNIDNELDEFVRKIRIKITIFELKK